MRIITLVSIVAPSGAFTVDSELVSDFMWMVIQYTTLRLQEYYLSPFTVNNPIFTLIYQFYLEVKTGVVLRESIWLNFPESSISERCLVGWYWCNERGSLLCTAVTAPLQLYNVKSNFGTAWTGWVRIFWSLLKTCRLHLIFCQQRRERKIEKPNIELTATRKEMISNN